MSSAGLLVARDPALYAWDDALREQDYLFACYEITTTVDGHAAALGMAMEQSAATSHIAGYVEPTMLLGYSIRVRMVRSLGQAVPVVGSYQLDTPVYGAAAGAGAQRYQIELAVPLRLLAGKPAQLWNVVVGELPRLGYLTGFALLRADLPASFGPGPGFGAEALLAWSAHGAGPLLCRSMRPAVGVDEATMARLNHDVLLGGFDIVKDDELQVFADFATFASHVRAMLVARDAASAATGLRKRYIANLICEPWELAERWALVCELGVDGVLVAPWIQGMGTLLQLARQRRMPILAHNTLGELFSRNPGWRVAPAVLAQWLRVLGADLIVTDGDFGDTPGDADAQAALAAARAPQGECRAVLPILQGGKQPDGLPRYRAAIGSDAYMLIVASWVDHHPDGIATAAAQFRAAVDGQPAAG
ncbi:Ribulose 1,5-bisphosphate carboxylase, large subunit, or a RuBisCO-like protein [Andreprevotia lacus DSM 23236]|jgi:ribulose 1,5-bisphosphate carboxylase large subunit-like protein|uniref:Ribulose 1,5-bisphosphate carboxylase, large subunit, or a RuBisCO-like protein n=1 Tax=Andreprevotia lacus DSM 23236 TaxID=1121001 RepID=A0A1W1XKI2_9NEIS|nr:RuBisCO large subunit C-terminal-like domain-containing protein [Andreprevotia lacus]SMC24352.1 Ribulose 1,5-bisphosphate carboxylase, large subunit, or a RuBisCO-like protein [Andreprevotia lacus DSM 23236]